MHKIMRAKLNKSFSWQILARAYGQTRPLSAHVCEQLGSERLAGMSVVALP